MAVPCFYSWVPTHWMFYCPRLACKHEYTFYNEENLVISQSIWIIVIKSKETRVITYTAADILVGLIHPDITKL